MIARKKGLWRWLFQRLSGLYLVYGMIVHFWILHFTGEEKKFFEKVAEKLHDPCWVLFDVSLLAIALYHGVVGIWNIILDFNISELSKKVIGWSLTIVSFAAGIVGLYTISAFVR